MPALTKTAMVNGRTTQRPEPEGGRPGGAPGPRTRPAALIGRAEVGLPDREGGAPLPVVPPARLCGMLLLSTACAAASIASRRSRAADLIGIIFGLHRISVSELFSEYTKPALGNTSLIVGAAFAVLGPPGDPSLSSSAISNQLQA